jgi:hypothetical protein
MLNKKIPRSKENSFSLFFGDIFDDLTYKTIEEYAFNYNFFIESSNNN